MFVVIGLAAFSLTCLCAIGLFVVPDKHTFLRTCLMDFGLRTLLLTGFAVLSLALT